MIRFGVIYDYINDSFSSMEIDLPLSEFHSSLSLKVIGYAVGDSLITFSCIENES